MPSSSHPLLMQRALILAATNLGQTWPNPAVGAVIVKDDVVIGEGCTARGGRPHAETIALQAAGDAAKGATLYVTLEPCTHHGKTPPCVDAIIKAGITRVVVACRDPHPQHGGGIEKLKSTGIDVVENVCEAEARELNRGFFSVVEKGRPFVALKIATSADGKIAFPPLPPGEGRGEGLNLGAPSPRALRHPLPKGEGIKWITGEAARKYGHRLRSEFDAIATGIGTVLADDPLLTCRLRGLEDKSPVRVVFDSQFRLPVDSQLAKTAKDVPVWVVAATQPDTGCQMPDVKYLTSDIHHPASALSLLAEKGITRLMVEGGQRLTTAFLESGLVDRIYWFRAPETIGKGGLCASTEGGFPPEGWETIESLALAPDNLYILEPCSPGS